MKGLMITGVIGLVFFGGAYAFSTMQLMKQQTAEVDPKTNDDLGEPDKVVHPESNQMQTTGAAEDMAVPFAPKALNETEIMALVDSVRKKETALRFREEQLNKRESKMRLILSDIQREKREFEAVVKEAQSKVAEGQKILKSIETQKLKVENDLKQIDEIQRADTSMKNFRKEAGDREIVKVLETIQPEKLAVTLTNYANEGQLERVGEILSQLDKAKASKVIEAITDPNLQVDVIEAARVAYANQAGYQDFGKNKK